MAFRLVHSLRRWSFTLCTSRVTSISGYLDILNCRTSSPADMPLCWWTSTPSTCSIVNFNPDELLLLEVFQGIELMLRDLFFLIVLVVLSSNHMDFDPIPIACGRPGSGPSAGTRSTASDLNLDRLQFRVSLFGVRRVGRSHSPVAAFARAPSAPRVPCDTARVVAAPLSFPSLTV
jgi:hypothetical protein